jgi:SAM-dependent methyltransferase
LLITQVLITEKTCHQHIDKQGDGLSQWMTTMADNVESLFKIALHGTDSPKVLELGTLRSNAAKATHHAAWLPPGATHVMSDLFPGEDVDVVADAHSLAPFEDESFDALIAVSVWEHLSKPWIAAEAAARVLRPGGLLYVATHHTFPVHGYPSDYTRWTDEGLKSLFDAPLWKDQVAGFSYPCTIVPPSVVKIWNVAAPAFLNVDVFAIKA